MKKPLKIPVAEFKSYREGFVPLDIKDWLERYKGARAYTQAFNDAWRSDNYNGGTYLASKKKMEFLVFPVAMKFILTSIMSAGVQKGRKQILESLKK